MIHVQNIFCNAQAVFLSCSFRMHQSGSFGKTCITDKALFALAYNGGDGFADDALAQQNSGQVGQIFVENCILQSNAGSGDNDGQLHPFGTIHLPKNTGYKVSQRLAGAYACFAQGNFLII